MDQSVFEQLIRERLPELAERVPDVSALSSVSLSWFLTLFLSVLPFLSAVRVVDCFFLHGINAIFRLGLTALEANAALLSACTDDGQALMILARCPGFSLNIRHDVYIRLYQHVIDHHGGAGKRQQLAPRVISCGRGDVYEAL